MCEVTLTTYTCAHAHQTTTTTCPLAASTSSTAAASTPGLKSKHNSHKPPIRPRCTPRLTHRAVDTPCYACAAQEHRMALAEMAPLHRADIRASRTFGEEVKHDLTTVGWTVKEEVDKGVEKKDGLERGRHGERSVEGQERGYGGDKGGKEGDGRVMIQEGIGGPRYEDLEQSEGRDGQAMNERSGRKTRLVERLRESWGLPKAGKSSEYGK
ncbi:hypothetical protein FH972_024330 [Carpinus fangiana]|uniref:Uncharacterized protein n=1 Tax=Carpinus fangiana TaxID=176857 RepID=A0A5N6KY89_9ROSI|nr:hypothetical protein FH972_024330 [Carpinus fangiana]